MSAAEAQPVLSLSLLLGVAGAAGLYYLLPHRLQNIWLLAVSYAVCAAWAWQAGLVLLLATSVNFWLALRLGAGNPGRRCFLALGLGLNVVALAAFRLADFFVPQASALLARLGFATAGGALHLLVPLGLSFYSLQNLAYIAEVYRGRMPATARFADFALYLAFFPKLLAGPIE